MSDGAPATAGLSLRLRLLLFAGVCVVAAVVAVAGVVFAQRSRDDAVADARRVPSAPADTVRLDETPALLFENTALGADYGRLAVADVDDPDGERLVTELSCERVHFRAGRGVCLQADRGFFTTYEAITFGPRLDEIDRIGLAGSPSRVRVSPGGALAGVTVFVTGHSYAESGFSTQTTLIDLDAGQVIADLETDFTVIRDGATWREIDFNFWGVTFIDDASFYATLGTGGETHLVRGSVETREFEVLETGVECPSLSPDGTRVAFKVRSEPTLGVVEWHVAVLDLTDGDITMLAEERNVDDQVAWYDDDTITYGIPVPDSPAETDTWRVPADGTGQPELLVPRSWSTTLITASG